MKKKSQRRSQCNEWRVKARNAAWSGDWHGQILSFFLAITIMESLLTTRWKMPDTPTRQNLKRRPVRIIHRAIAEPIGDASTLRAPPRRPFVLCHAKTKAGTRTRAGMSQDKQTKAAKGADSSYSTQHLRRQMRCWPPPDNLHCPPLGLFIMVITSLGTHPRHLTAETSSQFTPSSCHTPRGAQVRSLESLK